jgi:hypothetical protein
VWGRGEREKESKRKRERESWEKRGGERLIGSCSVIKLLLV